MKSIFTSKTFAILIALLFSNNVGAHQVNYSKKRVAGKTAAQTMKDYFKNATAIEPKTMLLVDSEFKELPINIQSKVKERLYRYYLAKKKDKVLGYGFVTQRRAHIKVMTVLYVMNSEKIVESIQVLAFNDSFKYLPTHEWLKELSQQKIKNGELEVKRELSEHVHHITKPFIDGFEVAHALAQKKIP